MLASAEDEQVSSRRKMRCGVMAGEMTTYFHAYF